MPRVSVIIPTYKHRDFVLATLESVFAQTFTDYEVIVVNDGSPDDTAELLRPLVKARRIQYIEQDNAGQAAARNRGVAEAKGEFIAFLDDDDLWPQDKLEWQVATLTQRQDIGVVAGPADVVNDASCRPGWQTPLIPDITLDTLLRGNPIYSPGQVLIRTSLLKQLDGFNAKIWGADDWDLWFRVVKSSRMMMENRVALVYRLHANNASKQICRMLDSSFLVLEDHLSSVMLKERKALRLSAYQSFYAYLGLPIVDQIKHITKTGKLWLLPPYVGRLLKLSKVLATDPASARRVIADILPQSIRRKVGRMRPVIHRTS